MELFEFGRRGRCVLVGESVGGGDRRQDLLRCMGHEHVMMTSCDSGRPGSNNASAEQYQKFGNALDIF